jgi:hypothetical protein
MVGRASCSVAALLCSTFFEKEHGGGRGRDGAATVFSAAGAHPAQ